MKVADAMSRHVDHVSSDTKVKAVSLLIFGRGINGVPVCKARKVIGFITERDILSQFYPSLDEYAQDPFREGDFEGMEKKVQDVFEMTADKIMSTNITRVTPDTPLLRAQSLMFTENEDYNDWLSKTYYQAVDTEDRLSHEIPDLLKVFTQHNVKTILDIGCGTGDHTIDLARRGFNAVGTDRSHGMIREANKRKQVLSKEALGRLEFYRGSFEDIQSKFTEPFDAALILGNTLSHNPHKCQKLIKQTAKHLSEHGVLILQVTNFDKVIKVKNRLLSFNFAKLSGEPNKEYAFLEFYDLPIERYRTILKTFAILV